MANFNSNPAGSPPVSFSFRLSFSDQQEKSEAAFQEVSGISMETNIREVTTGGENRFKYRLPVVNKFSNLVLKRGLVPIDSPLIKWCNETLNQSLEKPVQPKKVTVTLIDANQKVMISWDFIDAYPVKWSVSEFRSVEEDYVVELLELAYSYFTTVKV